MKYEDSLYCIMERAMCKMTSAEDLTTLVKRWDESIDDYVAFINEHDISLINRISYRAWLDQTYLMLRTYLKE